MKTFRDLPKDGVTGEWKFSISDSGYSNCDVMLEVVEDLDNYVIEKQIPKPVILFMDGFKGHYGIEINEECDKQGIQLWLLRAHMSHVIQPADVVMFNAVKRRAKMKAHEWQGKHPSETLNRYTFIEEAVYPALQRLLASRKRFLLSVYGMDCHGGGAAACLLDRQQGTTQLSLAASHLYSVGDTSLTLASQPD